MARQSNDYAIGIKTLWMPERKALMSWKNF